MDEGSRVAYAVDPGRFVDRRGNTGDEAAQEPAMACGWMMVRLSSWPAKARDRSSGDNVSAPAPAADAASKVRRLSNRASRLSVLWLMNDSWMMMPGPAKAGRADRSTGRPRHAGKIDGRNSRRSRVSIGSLQPFRSSTTASSDHAKGSSVNYFYTLFIEHNDY